MVIAPLELAGQADTLSPRPDTLPPPGAAADSAPAPVAPDTATAFLPPAPRATPPGPLAAGQRFVYDGDSLRFNGLQTLSDLLVHVPGVHVGRGGFFGQPEPLFYGGRGAAGLEIYWDGVPYLPLGRDSVFLDPARVPLGPLQRVEVVVDPAVVRVYLVTLSPTTTEPITGIEIATGTGRYAVYRGLFARRWRSGFGLALRADFGATNGYAASPHTNFRNTDLWVRLEYAPSPRYGVDLQLVGSTWKRDAGPPGVTARDVRRSDRIARAYYRTRTDGLGLRVLATYALSGVNADSALVPDTLPRPSDGPHLHQGSLEADYAWPRASVTARAAIAPSRMPLRVDLAAAWRPVAPVTLAADARHATYAGSRSGRRVRGSVGLALPLGVSLRGDAVLARDVQAATVPGDTVQETTDLAAAIRWQRSFATLEGGVGRRSAFRPVGFPDDLVPAAALGPTPETDYVLAHASLRPLPGLQLAGWYADPVSGGGDFEPPRHARYSAAFHSKFWRKFRSGAFTLHAEVAAESWSGGRGGRDTLDTPLRLLGATFVEANLRLQILELTLFWVIRNVNLMSTGFVPGRDYPRSVQYYGAHWSFRN